MAVDLSRGLERNIKKIVAQARENLKAGRLWEAGSDFARAASMMRVHARSAPSMSAKRSRLSRAAEWEALARHLMSRPDQSPREKERPEGGGGTGEVEAEDLTHLIHKSSVTWDDVVGLEETKEQLKIIYGLSVARRPSGFRIRSGTNVLLFGPPGTGKTLLAAATSNGLEATFFDVRARDLLSKYFGDSPRRVGRLYDLARERQPSVVFLDELDALAGQRGAGDSGAERRVLAALLSELDGLRGKDEDILVITMAATNAPWDLDPAVLSRFPIKVHVPLPGREARAAIVERSLHNLGLELADPPEAVADLCGGFSGREIDQGCWEAVYAMVREENPDLLRKVDEGLAAVRRHTVRVRPLKLDDFRGVFGKMRPTTTLQDAERYQRWMAETREGS
jgi:SpoVK/Ycf46/Vps4 family AAA+-type ATPase